MSPFTLSAGNILRGLNFYANSALRLNSNSHLESVCIRLISQHSSPTLIITKSAANKLKQLNEKFNEKKCLRLSVESGGCHGFKYEFMLIDKEESRDVVVEKDGVKFVVDEIFVPLIKGSKIDYEEELISSGFKVSFNPNAKLSCGCKISFDA